MTIDAVDLCEDFVRIPSVNQDLDPSGEGETAMAHRVADVLRELGATPELRELEPGRPNVTAVFEGATGAPTLLFESHLDTVPLADPPQPVTRDGGRIWGRGSCDTKSSGAAMLAAIERVVSSGELHATLVYAGVVDEEYLMRGAQELLGPLPPIDGAVIGEPTELVPIRAHNGCVRFDLEAVGLTAHSSRAELGVNAVLAAAEAMRVLDAEIGDRRRGIHHPLTGQGLLTPTNVSGGVAPNVVPDRCTVRYDRRLVPGESPAVVLAEVDAVLADLRATGHDVTRSDAWLELPPMETAAAHPLVALAESASSSRLGHPTSATGVPYCTDACVLTGRDGLASVVLGPGSIDQAHTPVEWVDIAQIEQAADMYEMIAREAAEADRWPSEHRRAQEATS